MRGLTDAEAAFLAVQGEDVSHLRDVAEDLVRQRRLKIVPEADGWDHAYTTPAGDEALIMYRAGIR